MTRRLHFIPLLAPSTLLLLGLVAIPLLSIAWLSFQVHKGEGLTLRNYVEIFTDPFYAEIYWRTFALAFCVTVISVWLGTWAALALYRIESRWRSIILLACLVPLLISVIVRTMGWALLLSPTGLVNLVLVKSGLIAQPIELLYTATGVVIALVHVTAPYVVISVWASLERIPRGVELAAVSLGASRLTTLRRITIPLAMPGILSATLLVFAISFGAFATPAIMGGGRLKMAANIAYEEFLTTQNWPMGAAPSVVILLMCAAILGGVNLLVEYRYKLSRQGL